MPLIADLSQLPNGLRKKIHEVCTNEFTVQAQLAKIRQQKIAKFFHDHTPRSIEGMGGQEMALDPFIVQYLSLHHGADFWQDRDFREWVRKRHDFSRVTSTGTKIMAGYGSKSDAATRKKFSRRFNDAGPATQGAPKATA